jgi:hypothetical protein
MFYQSNLLRCFVFPTAFGIFLALVPELLDKAQMPKFDALELLAGSLVASSDTRIGMCLCWYFSNRGVKGFVGRLHYIHCMVPHVCIVSVDSEPFWHVLNFFGVSCAISALRTSYLEQCAQKEETNL